MEIIIPVIPQKNAWDIIKVDVMQQLIHQKVRSCTEFKECLIDSDNKVLIEATADDFWASGLNVNITKCTNINFIPGQNTLGKILMAEREVCFKEENHARELQEAIDFQNEKNRLC